MRARRAPILGFAPAALNATSIRSKRLDNGTGGSTRAAPRSKSTIATVPPGRSAPRWWRTTATGSARWNRIRRPTTASNLRPASNVRTSPCTKLTLASPASARRVSDDGAFRADERRDELGDVPEAAAEVEDVHLRPDPRRLEQQAGRLLDRGRLRVEPGDLVGVAAEDVLGRHRCGETTPPCTFSHARKDGPPFRERLPQRDAQPSLP